MPAGAEMLPLIVGAIEDQTAEDDAEDVIEEHVVEVIDGAAGEAAEDKPEVVK